MHCNGTTKRGKPCTKPIKRGQEFCHLHKLTSIVVPQQCSARTRGHRCKHRTLRGTLCYQHLIKLKQLRIKKSTLPGAGFGLFGTKPFHRGEKVAPYSGDVVVSNDPEFGDDYTLQIKRSPPTFITARRTNTGEGRYANARNRGLGQGYNNAQLIFDARAQEANVKATKTIPTGTEITVAYGAQYWRDRNRNR